MRKSKVSKGRNPKRQFQPVRRFVVLGAGRVVWRGLYGDAPLVSNTFLQVFDVCPDIFRKRHDLQCVKHAAPVSAARGRCQGSASGGATGAESPLSTGPFRARPLKRGGITGGFQALLPKTNRPSWWRYRTSAPRLPAPPPRSGVSPDPRSRRCRAIGRPPPPGHGESAAR